MKTFIYSLSDPITKQVRYIGKANNANVRYYNHLRDKTKTHKGNWIRSLLKQNLKPELAIVDEVSIADWQFWERHYISLYKSWGFKLTNKTEGGDNPPSPRGRKDSRETRLKKSNALKLFLKNNPVARKKRGDAQRGKERSKETKRKISLKNLGRIISPEGRKRMSIAQKGKKFSKETVKKRSLKLERKVNWVCPFCNTNIILIPYRAKRQKFCSCKCREQNRKINL